MQTALLYEKLSDNAVRCHTCQRNCYVALDKTGVCQRYKNRSGILYNLNYAKVSSVGIDPIEKKPLYHFHPGTLCFSLGSWGCNFNCPGCQNWDIACAAGQGVDGDEISPEESVELAQKRHCQGIAWTYNEPTMWLEYSRDAARLARSAGLYTAYVTNGYITAEALDAIGPYLQAWRVDIKGFSDKTYKQITGIDRWQGILEIASRAKHKWNMHLEVVTNIIPAVNDDYEQLSGIADWITKELGELTPWHVTRFYPQHKMTNLQVTPIETLERAREIGNQAGLKFVYLGNIGAHPSANTLCYNCQELIVRRNGFQAEVLGLSGSRCQFCGTELNFRI